MAKKINLADLVFKVSDDGTLKVFSGQTKKAGKELKNVEKQQQKTTYATKKGINQTANQTKNFANLARGISGSLVPAYATLAANVFALTAVFQFLTQAADYRVLKEGQANYAHVTGIAYETLTNRIIDATDAQVRYTEAAQAAAIGTAAGLNADQLVKLGEAAKLVSVALGRDVTDSFNRLVRGVTKAEPELLDELGIILRLDPATRNYAAALGVSKESLNAFQRTQAVTNEVLDQVDKKFAAIAAVSDPTTNSINKLTKAFDDLMNTFRLAIAGPAEALANFFSNNLRAAIGALGLFILPLIQSMLPAFDNMAAEAEKSFSRQQLAIEKTRGSLEGLRAKQAQVAAQAAAGRAGQQNILMGLARGELGTGSSAAQKQLAAGRGISNAQLASLRAQATKEIGIFKNMDAQILANWKSTMAKMAASHKVNFSEKVKLESKKLELTMKAGFARIRIAWSATMKGMSRAASLAGKVISRAFAIFSGISIALLAFEGIKAGLEKFGMFGQKAEEADNSLKGLLQRQKELNEELDKMFAKDEKMAEQGVSLGFDLLLKQNANRVTEAFGQQLGFGLIDQARKNLAEVEKQQGITLGSLNRPEGKKVTQIGINPNTGAEFEERVFMTEGQQAVFDASLSVTQAEEQFLDRMKKVGKDIPELAGIFERGVTDVEQLTDAEKDFIARTVEGGAALAGFEQGATKLTQTLQGIAPKARASSVALREITNQTKNLRNIIATTGEKGFGGTAEAQRLRDKVAKDGEDALTDDELTKFRKVEMFDKLGGIGTALGDSITKGDALTAAKAAQANSLKNLKDRILANTNLGKVRQTNLKIATKQAEIEKVIADIALARVTLEDAANKEDAQQAITELQQRLGLLQQQKSVLEDSISITAQLGKAFSESFEKSLTSSIQGLLDGTKSLKDAFKDMTRAVLNAMAQILAQQMALRIMGSMFPGVGGRQGGIMSAPGYRSYSMGGVASGPNSGYPAMLHGTEAVVPLPNGRSIPVEMQGGAGSVNNVVINVDAGGNASSTFNEEQGKALGMAIQASVMETIQREKRPGGVLS